jgi:hypothetical protein
VYIALVCIYEDAGWQTRMCRIIGTTAHHMRCFTRFASEFVSFARLSSVYIATIREVVVVSLVPCGIPFLADRGKLGASFLLLPHNHYRTRLFYKTRLYLNSAPQVIPVGLSIFVGPIVVLGSIDAFSMVAWRAGMTRPRPHAPSVPLPRHIYSKPLACLLMKRSYIG